MQKNLHISEKNCTFAPEKQIHMKRILVFIFTLISLATMAQALLWLLPLPVLVMMIQ